MAIDEIQKNDVQVAGDDSGERVAQETPIIDAMVEIIAFAVSAAVVLGMTVWAFVATAGFLGSFIGAMVAIFAFMFASSLATGMVYPLAKLGALIFIYLAMLAAPIALIWWLLVSI